MLATGSGARLPITIIEWEQLVEPALGMILNVRDGGGLGPEFG